MRSRQWMRPLIAASAALTISGAQAQTPNGPIKIGLVQAQTGALADSFGIPSSEGAILAMEEIAGVKVGAEPRQ